MDDPYEIMAYYYDLFATAPGAGQTSPRSAVFISLARPSDEVLDIGSGTGSASMRLAAGGHRVHSFEPSRAMRGIHLSKLAAAGAVRDMVTVSSMERDFPRGIDYAMGAGILQCLVPVERRSLFRRVRDALRPGGRLAFDMVVDEPHHLDSPRHLFSEAMLRTTVLKSITRSNIDCRRGRVIPAPARKRESDGTKQPYCHRLRGRADRRRRMVRRPHP